MTVADQYKVVAGAVVVKGAEAGERMVLRGQVFNGDDYDKGSVGRLLKTGLVVKVHAAPPKAAPAAPKN